MNNRQKTFADVFCFSLHIMSNFIMLLPSLFSVRMALFGLVRSDLTAQSSGGGVPVATYETCR